MQEPRLIHPTTANEASPYAKPGMPAQAWMFLRWEKAPKRFVRTGIGIIRFGYQFVDNSLPLKTLQRLHPHQVLQTRQCNQIYL